MFTVRRGRLQPARLGAIVAEAARMSPARPEHLRHFDYCGFHRYLLTFCTMQRARLFVTHAVVDLVLEQFLRSATQESVALAAYCFMPDHVHLLVAGTSENSDAKRFIARAKQYSGFYCKQQHQSRLWQRYGFERVLRDNESTLAVARYIVENTLRAGLVSDPRQYPFLGSSVYTLDEILSALQDSVAPDFDVVRLKADPTYVRNAVVDLTSQNS